MANEKYNKFKVEEFDGEMDKYSRYRVEKFDDEETEKEIKFPQKYLDSFKYDGSPVDKLGQDVLESASMIAGKVPIVGTASKRVGRELGEYLGGPKVEQVDQWERERERKQPIRSNLEGLFAGGAVPGAASVVSKLAPGMSSLMSTGASAVANAMEGYWDAVMRGQKSPEEAAAMQGGWSVVLDSAFKLGPKFFSRFIAGLDKKTVNEYMQRKFSLDSTADRESIGRTIDESLAKQRSKITGQESEIEKAKQSFDEATSLSKSKYESDLLADRLNDYLDAQARTAKKESIRTAQIDSDLPKNLIEAMKKSRAEQSQLSTEAFNVLKKSGVKIDIRPFVNDLNKMKTNLLIAGKEQPTNPETIEAIKRINQKISHLKKMTPRIPVPSSPFALGPQAKNKVVKRSNEADPVDFKLFLQDLSDDLSTFYHGKESAQWVSKVDRGLDSLYTKINQYLYNLEGYEDVMRPLIDKTRNLNDMTKAFGNEKSGGIMLTNLRKFNNRGERATLQKFDELNRTNLMGDLQPFEALKEAKIPPKPFKNKIEPPDYKKLPEFKNLTDQKNKLVDIKNDQKFLNLIGTGQSVTNALVSKGVRTKYRVTDALKELGKRDGVDYVQMIDDVALVEAMNKPFMAGGRNVYMNAYSFGGALGLIQMAATGTKDSQIGKMIGEAIGAMSGGMFDLTGRKMVKFMLDLDSQPGIKKEIIKTLIDAYKKGPRFFTSAALAQARQDADFRDYIDEIYRKEALNKMESKK